MQYRIGDDVPIRYEVRDVDTGDLLSGGAMTVLVTKPDATTVAPTMTETSTGMWEGTVDGADVDTAGIWIVVITVSAPYDDVVASQFSVSATPDRLYAGLPLLRQNLGITDGERDQLLLTALSSACRRIDRRCGRRFWADEAVTQRVYDLPGRTVRGRRGQGEGLIVDDIASTTGLIVEVGSDTAGWTAITDYRTEPTNALADGEPITLLRRILACWPVPPTQARVTARHGWPAIPDELTQASLILGSRFYKRRSSPEGVTGSAEWGTMRVSKLDPDVESLISNLIIPGF